MRTLTSRKVQDDLTKISKITLDPNDVLVIQPDLMNMTDTQRQKYIDAVRVGFGQIFPNNKIVVLDKSVDINIVTIT